MPVAGEQREALASLRFVPMLVPPRDLRLLTDGGVLEPDEQHDERGSGSLGRATELVRLWAPVTREVCEPLPTWARPIGLVAILAFTAVVWFILLLTSPIFKPREYFLGSALELRRHVERVWRERSPEAATEIVRDVLRQLDAASPEAVPIAPFGRFDQVVSRMQVDELLYSYEVALGNWAAALDVAERSVALVGERKAGSWLLSKAECLARLNRRGEAKELLLRNLDPKNPNSRTHQMLLEL